MLRQLSGTGQRSASAGGDAGEGPRVVDGVAFKKTREVYVEDSRLVQQLLGLARSCVPRGAGGAGGGGAAGAAAEASPAGPAWVIPQAAAALRDEARFLARALHAYSDFVAAV